MDTVVQFICAQCGKVVDGVWVEPDDLLRKRGRKDRWEPSSQYWHGEDIEEAYCSAQCSLNRHEENNNEYR